MRAPRKRVETSDQTADRGFVEAGAPFSCCITGMYQSSIEIPGIGT